MSDFFGAKMPDGSWVHARLLPGIGVELGVDQDTTRVPREMWDLLVSAMAQTNQSYYETLPGTEGDLILDIPEDSVVHIDGVSINTTWCGIENKPLDGRVHVIGIRREANCPECIALWRAARLKEQEERD